MVNNYPTIGEYNQLIQKKGGNAFKSLNGINLIPSMVAPIKVYLFGSGAFAAVFKGSLNGTNYAIRCFLTADNVAIDRYKIICDYLNDLDASWKTECEFLEDEISVNGNSYPILKMEWLDGLLINQFISNHLSDKNVLTELQKKLVAVSDDLEKHKIGHGDLQCGNIIITGSSSNFQVKLIDYDGMYVPALSNKKSIEKGRSEFQHPKRTMNNFSPEMDRFSFWVMITALEALKVDKTLWLQVMQGGFNTLDNMLFIGQDFEQFNSSKLVNKLYNLNKPSLSFYLDKLNKFCNSSFDEIETPTISNAISQPNIIIHGKEFENLNIHINTNPHGAWVINSNFERLGKTPLTLNKNTYKGEVLIIAFGTQVKKIPIDENCKEVNLNFEEIDKPNILPNPIITSPKPAPPSIQTKKKKSFIETDFFLPICIIGIFAFILALSTIIPRKKTSFSTETISVQAPTAEAPATEAPATQPLAIEAPAIEEVNTELTAIEAPVSAVPPIGEVDNIEGTLIKPDFGQSKEFTDDFNNSPEEVVSLFLNALSDNNCTEAWAHTYNPRWEKKGKSWFCSYEAFGALTKINVRVIQSLNCNYVDAEVYVNYCVEDFYNGNKCFFQKFILQRISDMNGKSKWMISRLLNLQPPIVQ
ncbi:MAG: hypothetical protein IPI46_08020 [Bacteroidetes bacterium]|nr:hypothetical protein [Bacteroidota bacterium]